MSGWIEHDGGPCPTHPKAHVELRSRCGVVFEDIAGILTWEHERQPTKFDIVAWRPFPSEPDPRPTFGDPVGPWHWWFAWKPVRTYDNRRVWLRWVRRRNVQKHEYLHGGGDRWWQYHSEGVRT